MEYIEPRGQELINRYKGNYKISDDVLISEDMILKHWQLEKALRIRLLESTPENRWETFEKCYTMLYKELEWLNKYSKSGSNVSPEKLYAKWPLIIGEIPKDIFEIGSGNGLLISYLSNYGYKIKGTEITHERGETKESLNPNLSWCVSDGRKNDFTSAWSNTKENCFAFQNYIFSLCINYCSEKLTLSASQRNIK